MNALYQWYQIAEQLRTLKQQEAELRRQVIAEYFPELSEGTNKVPIEGNAQLVATLPYNYSIDEEALEAALEHVPKSKQDTLVKWKPSLALSVYRTLSKKALTAFTAECLTVKPGSPSLKIVPADE